MSKQNAYSGVGNEAVLKQTGRGWDAWFTLLDEGGAVDLEHPAIVKLVGEAGVASGWWQQQITVAYELARGKRVAHQKTGGFEISKSKTVNVPAALLYEAVADERRREGWMPGHPVHVRKATPEKSMRVTWTDERTSLDIYFYAKGRGKSQIVVNHTKLADPDEAEQKKAFWSDALTELKKYLETS
ncbi:MAG: hypothetical protein QNK37_10630 [Acidobacteriota bacterium]|nr:hypothetical protein [Acidobacteriota bacterium]